MRYRTPYYPNVLKILLLPQLVHGYLGQYRQSYIFKIGILLKNPKKVIVLFCDNFCPKVICTLVNHSNFVFAFCCCQKVSCCFGSKS